MVPKMFEPLKFDCIYSYSPTTKYRIRADFTSKLVHVLPFGTPKFYIAPYDKIKHELVNLSSNCDVKSGLVSQKEKKIHVVSDKELIQICLLSSSQI